MLPAALPLGLDQLKSTLLAYWMYLHFPGALAFDLEVLNLIPYCRVQTSMRLVLFALHPLRLPGIALDQGFDNPISGFHCPVATTD